MLSFDDHRVVKLRSTYIATNDTLHVNVVNVPYVRDEIKKLDRRYADRLEERFNILAIDLMSDAETPRGLKRKLPQHAQWHILFKTCTNCQMYR